MIFYKRSVKLLTVFLNVEKKMQQAFYSKTSLKNGLDLVISRIPAEAMQEALALLQPLTDETASHFYKEVFLLKAEAASLYLKASLLGDVLSAGSITKLPWRHLSYVGFLDCAFSSNAFDYEIATSMVRALIEWAKKDGILRLELSVLKENKEAVSFFQEFGFEVQTPSVCFEFMRRYFDKYEQMALLLK